MSQLVAPARPPFLARLVVVPAMVAALAAGTWFLGGVVAPGYVSSIVLTLGWGALVATGFLLLARRHPGLRLAVLGTLAAATVVGLAGFYWTSIRDDVVAETVVTGVPASQGPDAGGGPVNVTESRGAFESLAHPAEGAASVVRLAAGGRVLTLTGFETDNGPDLRVHLVSGAVNDNGDGDGSVDLGRLKGNVGDQQYGIPAGVDLRRFRTVVIWCRAFSVGFGRAELRPA